MVAGEHDGGDGEDRVERGEHLGPAVPEPGDERARAEQRPRAVHARHRRELVRDLAHLLGVERPERGVLGEGVDESVARGQETRRHQRPGVEADERDRRGDPEGVAPTWVVVRPPSEEVDAHTDGHHEVQRSVDVVHGDHEGPEVQCPLLQRALVVDAELLLPMDEIARVAERDRRILVHLVPHRGVDEVEREDHEELGPPVDEVPVAETLPSGEPDARGLVGRGRGRGGHHSIMARSPSLRWRGGSRLRRREHRRGSRPA